MTEQIPGHVLLVVRQAPLGPVFLLDKVSVLMRLSLFFYLIIDDTMMILVTC